MSKHLILNNKKYLSSQTAGKAVGYTSDYIGKLCRRGNISCRRIGRSWYIEEASLDSYISGKEFGNKNRRKELSQERKKEYKEKTKAFELDTPTPKVSFGAIASDYENTLEKPVVGVKEIFQPVTGTYFRKKFAETQESRKESRALVLRTPVLPANSWQEFARKAVALTTAIAVIFGTYTAVDAQNSGYAIKVLENTAIEVASVLYSIPQIAKGTNEVFENTLVAFDTFASQPAASILGHSVLSKVSALDLAEKIYINTNSLFSSIAQGIKSNEALYVSGNDRGRVNIFVRSIAPAITVSNTLNKEEFLYSTTNKGSSVVEQTIINNPIIERVIETERVVTQGGVTLTQLQETENELRKEIARVSIANTGQTTNNFRNIALTQRIDKLSGTDITNATFAGGTITNSPISGSSGSFTTLTVSGATTLANVSISGTLTDASNSVGTSGEVLTSTGTSTEWVLTSALSVGNADTLDTLDSLQFLRSDADDSTSGTLTAGGFTTTGTTTLATTTATALTAETGTFSGALSALSATITNAFSAASATVTGLLTTGSLTVSGTATTTDLVATNSATLATTTITGDLAVNTNDLYIDSSTGRVGIGTASPGALLALESGGSDTKIIINNTATDGDSIINFRLPGINEWSIGIDDGDDDKFKIADNGDLSSTRLTIDQSGNVGIGDTTPSYKLDVAGTGRFTGNAQFDGSVAIGPAFTPTGAFSASFTVSSSVNDISGLGFKNTSTGTSADSRFTAEDTTGNYLAFSLPGVNNTVSNLFGLTRNTTAFIFNNGGTTRDLAIGTLGTKALVFGTTNAERMRIDSSGNVGIGDTTPDYLLDVAGTLGVTGASSLATTTITGDLTVNTNDLFVDTSTGRVGIGTASPSNSLQVNSGRIVVGSTDIGNVTTGIVTYGTIDNTAYGYQAGQTSTNNITFGWVAKTSATNGYGYMETYAGSNDLLIMRDGTGKVGIGIANGSYPSYKLDVVGITQSSGGFRTNSETITDFSGTGITVTGGALTTTLGTSITSSEIVDDTIVNADINSAAAIDISKTALVAGTNITLSANTLNIDDAFLINSGDDTTSGVITAGGFTTTGTTTLATTTATALTAETGTFSGALSALSATITNAFSAASATVTGLLTTGSLTVSGTATTTDLVATNSATLATTTITDATISGNASVAGTLGVTGDLTVNTNDLFVDTSTGRVGIGTASPSEKLQIKGGAFQQINSDNWSGIYLDAPLTNEPKIGFRVSDNTERFRMQFQGVNGSSERIAFIESLGAEKEVLSILNSGNVGIGTTSPTSKLSVYGNALLEGTNRYLNFGTTAGSTGYGVRDNAGTIEIKDSGGSWAAPGSGSSLFTDGGTFAYLTATGDDLVIGTSTSPGSARLTVQSEGTSDILNLFETGGAEVFTVLESGRVGLGTASPSEKLHVKSTGKTEVKVEASDGSSAVLGLYGDGGGTDGARFLYDGANNLIKIQSWGTGGVLDRLVITRDTGNVGIGTTTPTTALYVVGTTTLEALTINSETITDFSGTGITVTGGALTTTLGTSVDLTSEITGTLPVANGGTGITSLGSGIATWWGTPTSANLAAALTDETGSGSAVFATSPTFTTSITIGSATISEAELEILDGATLSTTELNYVVGVTSAIQTQLDAKEGTLNNEAGLYAALSDVSLFLEDVVDDTTPQLGGNLDLNSNDITGTGNVNVTGTLTISATSTLATTTATSLSIGSLSGFLKATAGSIATALIDLTSDVTGTLPVANGGTGATTLANLITLGTDTTGNYVATLADAGNSFFTVSGSGSETAAVTLDIVNDSLNFAQLSDSLVLDATTTVDLDTNSADLNFDSNTLYIDSSTNRVGIGTAAPSSLLHLQNASAVSRPSQMLIETTASGGAGIQFKNTDFSANLFQVFLADDGTGLKIGRDSGGDYVTFQDGGNVGIGTTTPSAMLTVGATSTQQFLVSNLGVITDGVWNGTPIDLTSYVTGTLPVANGGTGITSLGTGIATWWGTPTSANLATALTDETGSGPAVFATSPTLVTPVLGVATATSIDFGATTLLASRSLTIDTGGVFDINLGTAGGDDFTIDTSAFVVEGDTGNVGIGTASPSSVLHIIGSRTRTFTVEAIGNVASSEIATIDFRNSNAIDATNDIIGQLSFFREVDVDTGAFVIKNSNGAGVLSESFRIDSSGNVGIGTTTIPARLTLQTTGTTDILNLFETGGTEVFTVLESGNVGIGTASPTQALEINGNLQFSGTSPTLYSSGVGSYIDIGNNDGGNIRIGGDQTDSSITVPYNNLVFETQRVSDDIIFKASSTEAMRIDASNGNVGIGTTTPTTALYVVGTTTLEALTINSETITDFSGTGITVTGNALTTTLGTSVDLTSEITGTLPVANGGTGITSLGSGIATWWGTPTSANLAAALTDETGTGALVFANTPTLVTPILGTPTSATLTNATGLPISTGVSGLGTGVATFLATPSSANLASALTNETGTGVAVFGTSPTFTTGATISGGSLAVDDGQGISASGANDGIIFSNGTGSILRLLNWSNDGWADTSTPNGFFQLGQNQGFFTGTSGAVLNRFGISSEGTTISNSFYTALPAPTAVLLVQTDTTTQDILNLQGVSSQTADYLNITSGAGAEGDVFTVNSSGNVGINDTTPTFKLDVAGTLRSTGLATFDSGISVNSETITDFSGTGITVTGGALTTTLGTSVDLTSEVTGTLPVANGGTGITSLGSGIATWWGTPTSANLASALTDETGSGVAVFGTAPTFTTSITIGLAIINEAELEILDGATLSTTELNYVVGVTSAIQTQLDAKEVQLNNEAGLYAVLSDVSLFLEDLVDDTTPQLGGNLDLNSSDITGTGNVNVTGTLAISATSTLATTTATSLSIGSLSGFLKATAGSIATALVDLANDVTGILPDANVADTLTIGASSTVDDAALSSGVSLLGQTIESSEITNGTITAVDLATSSVTTIEILDGTIANADINAAAAIDISKTALVAGTNITLSTNTLNIDDAFLINSGDDTTSGTITAGGFTTTGTSTLATTSITTFTATTGTFTGALSALSTTITNALSAASATITGLLTTGSLTVSGTATTTDFIATNSATLATTTASGLITGSAGLTISSGTISLPAGEIGNTELANSTVSYGGVALSLGGTDTTPAFNLSDATSLPLTTGVSGTLPVANGGTGITSLGSGIATWWGTPTSANLATALTDETGSGSAVFATSPTLVTPTLGVATATSIDFGGTTLLASRSLTIDTGGVFDINLGTASGDDFTIDTSAFVVEGDTGNVGIGTASPSSILHLEGSGTQNLLVRGTGSSDQTIQFGRGDVATNWIVGRDNTGSIFGIEYAASSAVGALSSSAAFTINSSGNVGIGETSPSSILELKSTTSNNILTFETTGLATTIPPASNFGQLDFYSSDASGQGAGNAASIRAYQFVNSGFVRGALGFFTADRENDANPVERLTIDQVGNVGIGTTTPLSKLSVYGNTLLEGASRYLNFGTTAGSTGYGVRDNAGTIEIKDSGGSWAAPGSGSALFTDGGTTTYLTSLTDDFAIGGSTFDAPLFFDESASSLSLNPFGASTGNTGELRFEELEANGDNYVGFKSPDSITTNTVFTLPGADGSAGQFLTTDASGNLAFATAGDGISPSFSVHRNSVDQSIPTATHTLIDWTTEDFDTNNNFDLTTDRFTPTVPGKYLLTYSATIESVANLDIIYGRVLKNGSIAQYKLSRMPDYSNNTKSVTFSVIVDANGTTDYFEASIYHNYGSSRTLSGESYYTRFTGSRIDGGNGLWTQANPDINYLAGAVSVGTTTTSARLNIQSTGTDDILNLFETGGSEVFTVLESGNVGIGTASPVGLDGTGIEIEGVTGGGAAFLRFNANGTAGKEYEFLSIGSNGNFGLYDVASTTYRWYVQNDGNVGIGDTSPSALLNVGAGNVSSADGTNDLYVLDDIEFDGDLYGAGNAILSGTLAVTATSTLATTTVEALTINSETITDFSGTGITVTGGALTTTLGTSIDLTSEVTGTLPVANGGTGITSLGTGIATWWGTPTSANLATALTDETGSGSAVFATSPTLVTPVLGVATATSIDFGGTTLLASRSLTIDTGGVFDINLGTASGDDFTIDTSAFVVEGDTGNVGIGTASPSAALEVVGNIVSKGTSWTAATSSSQNNWNSVTYGNGLFVAVSNFGTSEAMTSPDGINWTARSLPMASTNWNTVTYGNGLFVATAGGQVMTSPDGINWTERSSPETNNWTALTYANDLFVAASYSGTNRVMTSPDGITWTSRPSAAETSTWAGLAYGNDLFVAVSNTGTNQVMTSPDGITWTARSAAEANQWNSVTYGNGRFVAVSLNGTNRVMYSADGITWTVASSAEQNTFTNVTYGNGLFVAVAQSGTNRVMTSPDGITWTARADTGANSWKSTTYGNGRFVAVSFDGTNRVMTSGQPEASALATNNIYQGGRSIFGNTQLGTSTLGIVGTDAQLSIQTTGTTDILNLFETGGTEVFTVLESGNVGIGTAAPSDKLHVSGGVIRISDAGYAVLRLQSIDDTGSAVNFLNSAGSSMGQVLYDNASNYMRFNTNATERMRIDSTGNVGIGTTTPESKLDVISGSGTLLAFPSGTWASRIFNTTDSSTSNGLVVANRWAASASTAFEVGGLFDGGNGFDSFLKVDGTGNVGIGDTTPDYLLDVAGTAGFDGLLTLTGTSANIALGSNYLSGDGGDEGIFVDSSGNVGIGTASPSEILTIVADAGSTGLTPATILIDNTQSFVAAEELGGVLAFSASGDATNPATDNVVSTISSVNINTGSQFGLAFSTLTGTDSSVQERMRIDDTGNVGIGTSTPASRLAIRTTGTTDILNLFETGGSEVFTVLENGDVGIGIDTVASFNSGILAKTTLQIHQATTGNAGAGIKLSRASTGGLQTDGSDIFIDNLDDLYIKNNEDGLISFATNAIDRLTVTSTGNVGIGTTTPLSKLTVYGNALLEGASRYLNFGTTAGSTGYGVRDNAGTIEIKDSGGSWAAPGSGSSPLTTKGDLYTYDSADARLGVGTNGQVLVADSSAATGLAWAESSGGIAPAFSVQKSSTQSISASTVTLVTWETENFDTNSDFDLTTERFTPTVPGKYLLTTNVGLSSIASGVQTELRIYKNGTIAARQTLRRGSAQTAEGLSVSVIVDANGTTDYFEVFIKHFDSVSRSTTSTSDATFSGSRIDGGNGLWTQANPNINYLAGAVSVGTTTTSARLNIQSTGTDDILNLFETGGTEVFTVLESGKVGIGTATPLSLLHLEDTAPVLTVGATNLTSGLRVNVVGQSSGLLFRIQKDNSTVFQVEQDGDVIVNSGNVGIGTTAPAYKLDVAGTLGTTGDITINDTATAQLYLKSTSGNAVQVRLYEGTTERARFTYDAANNRTRILGYNGAATDRIRMEDGSDNILGDGTFSSSAFGPSEWAIGSGSPGDVVCTTGSQIDIDGERRVVVEACTVENSGMVVGVIIPNEESPGYGMPNFDAMDAITAAAGLPGNEWESIWRQTHVGVELTGYRSTNVVGPVEVGDLLVSSTVAGHAKASSKPLPGAILGKAVEAFTGTGTGTILARIQIQSGVPTEIYSIADAVSIDANGNVGIGTSTPTYKLQVVGDIAATSFVNLSSKALKTGITYIDEAREDEVLARIRDEVNIAEYRYISEDESNPLRLGLIAEEAPSEVLSVSGTGVDIYKLTTFTLAGVKAQQRLIGDLDVRLSDIETALASEASEPNGIVAVILSWFENIGITISESLAKFNNLAAVAFTVGSPEKPNGITLYDEETGVAYCVKIKGGVMVSEEGDCVQIAEDVANAETPTITLIGSSPANIALNANYSDLGVVAKDWKGADLSITMFLNGGPDLLENATTTQIQLDTSTSTTYTIDYFTEDSWGNTASTTRTVIIGDGNSEEETAIEEPTATSTPPVADTTAPVITVLGDNPASIYVDEVYVDAGATAVDETDGTLDVITTVDGIGVTEVSLDTSTSTTYTIEYTATDTAGNSVTVTRGVNIVVPIVTPEPDTTAPTITILGDNPTSVVMGEVYDDAGATATDEIDGEVSVAITSTVDTSVLGEYTVTYTAVDAAGNETTENRVVNIVAE